MLFLIVPCLYTALSYPTLSYHTLDQNPNRFLLVEVVAVFPCFLVSGANFNGLTAKPSLKP